MERMLKSVHLDRGANFFHIMRRCFIECAVVVGYHCQETCIFKIQQVDKLKIRRNRYRYGHYCRHCTYSG